MNCPKCGLQPLPDQKFCRSCGSNLQIITQPLAELTTVSHRASTPSIVSNGEQRRANNLPLWGFIIMFIGVAIGVIGKMLLHQDTVTVVGVLFSLLGMFLTAYPYLSPAPRQKRDSIASSQQEVLTRSQPTTYLPPESSNEYVPSITEGTTDLLETSAATRSRRKEDGDSQVEQHSSGRG